PIVGAVLLLSIGRALARIYVEHHWPGKSARAARFSGDSKRPIWLAEAAKPMMARSPTTQRIAGSRHSLSASLTSSQPASRPNTDWRSDTLGLTDTGAETLADARTGKNSRHRLAGLPRNCSNRRRSKSSLRAPCPLYPSDPPSPPYSIPRMLLNFNPEGL